MDVHVSAKDSIDTDVMEASLALTNFRAYGRRGSWAPSSPRPRTPRTPQTPHPNRIVHHHHHAHTPDATGARHRVPHHCGALLMCGLVWMLLCWSLGLAWGSVSPSIAAMGDAVLRTLNGEVAVTCRMGDVPLNHLRCMLFMRLTNWLHWTISSMSRYLSGLEDPWDMFCFLCTTLGGLYVTCSSMIRGICGSLMRLAYWATVRVYRGTYDCLNNQLSPFGYIESSMSLAHQNDQEEDGAMQTGDEALVQQ